MRFNDVISGQLFVLDFFFVSDIAAVSAGRFLETEDEEELDDDDTTWDVEELEMEDDGPDIEILKV